MLFFYIHQLKILILFGYNLGKPLRGLATKKNELFLSSQKKSEKNVATKDVGGGIKIKI